MANNLKKIKVQEVGDVDVSAPALPFSRPHIHLDDRQIKEVKNWVKDGKYLVIFELEMASRIDGEDDVVSGGFDVLAYKDITPEKDINKMSDKEFQKVQDEAAVTGDLPT